MHFTHDWFSSHIPLWERVLGHLNGQPLRALEIGSYEGRSAVWLLWRILSDPLSTLTCIDLWEDDATYQQFVANVAETKRSDRVSDLRGTSTDHLRSLAGSQFDVIYIDGSHEARDVLTDAALTWPLLAPGGYLIFDDYGWSSHEVNFPPRHAIDTFLQLWMTEIEVVHKGYQVIVRRRSPAATNASRSSVSAS